MTMKFKMGKRLVKLELERNENVPQLTYYYTAENGALVQWTLDQEQVKLFIHLIIITIIIIIHEFHRDASLETKLQGRCVSRITLMSMLLWPIVCVAV